jgi:hypothetical protein
MGYVALELTDPGSALTAALVAFWAGDAEACARACAAFDMGPCCAATSVLASVRQEVGTDALDAFAMALAKVASGDLAGAHAVLRDADSEVAVTMAAMAMAIGAGILRPNPIPERHGDD